MLVEASQPASLPAPTGSSVVLVASESDHSLLSILLVITVLSFLLALGFLAMRIAASLLKHALLISLFATQLATRQFNIANAHARSHAYANAHARCILSSLVTKLTQALLLVHSKWIPRSSQPKPLSNNHSTTLPLASLAFTAEPATKEKNTTSMHASRQLLPEPILSLKPSELDRPPSNQPFCSQQTDVDQSPKPTNDQPAQIASSSLSIEAFKINQPVSSQSTMNLINHFNNQSSSYTPSSVGRRLPNEHASYVLC